jgi:OsmC-like protein
MEEHRWQVRLIQSGTGSMAYARTHSFAIGDPVSFDQQHARVTALEYLLGALGGELIAGLRRLATARRTHLDNLEASISVGLESPLAYLGVHGEGRKTRLGLVSVRVFVETAASEDAVMRAWAEVLERSPLVRTLRDALQLEVELRLNA